MDKFQIFEPKFDIPELEEEFHNFFYKYNLSPLFTNEHRAGNISVAWVDAKSVVNPGGSYHNTLKEFSDYLSQATDNKSYEEIVFKIIYQAKTFQRLMRNIKQVMQQINTIDSEYLNNMWNIVWYAKGVI